MQIELGAFSIDKVLLLFRAKLFPLVQRKKRKKVMSLSCVRIFTTSWTVAYQASLSMGFTR